MIIIDHRANKEVIGETDIPTTPTINDTMRTDPHPNIGIHQKGRETETGFSRPVEIITMTMTKSRDRGIEMKALRTS